MASFAIVIPSLNPDELLPAYVRDLRAATDAPIILVDDGSDAENKHFFDEAEAVGAGGGGVVRLTHPQNRGKGAALKTAFAHILATPELAALDGCVTADSDGQHTVVDVLRVAESLHNSPEALVLGCRHFSGKNVPFRSWFGNNWMRGMYFVLIGRWIKDSQTGLRGIPRSWLADLVNVPGTGFEFESRMLAELHGRKLVQIEIETVYLEGNRRSHFKPLRDTIRIWKALLLR